MMGLPRGVDDWTRNCEKRERKSYVNIAANNIYLAKKNKGRNVAAMERDG